MQRLERHRGHFFNWYDTRTLKPLLPLYVSSVDSGNLAGHLLTLGSGLRELADEKTFTPQIFAGLRDTVRVLRDLALENAALAKLDAELEQATSSLRAAYAVLERATSLATQVAASLANRAEDLKEWGQTLKRRCEEHLEELRFLAPWLALPIPTRSRRREEAQTPPSLAAKEDQSLLSSTATKFDEKFAQLDQAPTLREVSTWDQSLSPLIEEGVGLAPWNNERHTPSKLLPFYSTGQAELSPRGITSAKPRTDSPHVITGAEARADSEPPITRGEERSIPRGERCLREASDRARQRLLT